MLELHCKEGSLGQIKCPQAGCGHSLDPQLIQSIVDPEVFERWERLTLQRSLDSMQVREGVQQEMLQGGSEC